MEMIRFENDSIRVVKYWISLYVFRGCGDLDSTAGQMKGREL